MRGTWNGSVSGETVRLLRSGCTRVEGSAEAVDQGRGRRVTVPRLALDLTLPRSGVLPGTILEGRRLADNGRWSTRAPIHNTLARVGRWNRAPRGILAGAVTLGGTGLLGSSRRRSSLPRAIRGGSRTSTTCGS